MTNAPSYYQNLGWKPWDDNAGQKPVNRVDYDKIKAAQLIPTAQDSKGAPLYIARQLSDEDKATPRFVTASVASLLASGEYHPADNTDCGRMVSNGKLEVVTKDYQVLSGDQVSLNFANYKTVSVLQWVDYTSETAQSSDLSNCLQVGVNASKEAVYACRFIAEKADNPDDGYAIGTYTTGGAEGEVPFSSKVLKSSAFQLLQVVPATIEDVRNLMVTITWAGAAQSATNKYLGALTLQPDTVSYFLAAEVAATGFDLSPALVVSKAPSELSSELNYLNRGFAALDAAGGIVIGLRGTMNFGNTSEGSIYDWANNFIAVQQYISGLGHVHPGFYYAALSLMGIEDGDKGLYGFVAEHMKGATVDNPVSISVCGHSKGGAMAQIIALLFKNKYKSTANITVCTFGAPMPGGSDFVAYLDASIPESYHYINKADPVPWLPFSNQTIAFGQYLANLPISSIIGIFETYLTTQVDASVIKSQHPTLTSSNSDQWVSLLLQAIFGDPSIITFAFPSIKQWLITEVEIEEVKTMLELLNPVALSGSEDAPTPEKITALFRHAFTLVKNGKLVNTTLTGALSQPGFDALVVGVITLLSADLAGANWIAYLRSLPLYADSASSNPNYAAFVDDILPLVESLADQARVIGGTVAGATTEDLPATWKSRYARAGNVEFIAPSVYAENGATTMPEVTPYMSFTQFLMELNPANLDAGNLKTQNPIADHGAYPEVIAKL